MGEIALRGLDTKTNKGLGYALLFFSSVVVFGFASDACADEKPDSGTCDSGRIIFLIIAGVVSAFVCIPWIIAFIFEVSILIKIEFLVLLFLFLLWGCIAGVSTDTYAQGIALGFAWVGFILTFVLLYISLATRGIFEKKKKEEASEEEKGKEEPAEPEKKEEAPAAAV